MRGGEQRNNLQRLFAWVSLVLACIAIGAAGAGMILQESSLMALFCLLVGIGGLAFGAGTLLRVQHPYAAPLGAFLSGVLNIAAVIVLIVYILSDR